MTGSSRLNSLKAEDLRLTFWMTLRSGLASVGIEEKDLSEIEGLYFILFFQRLSTALVRHMSISGSDQQLSGLMDFLMGYLHSLEADEENSLTLQLVESQLDALKEFSTQFTSGLDEKSRKSLAEYIQRVSTSTHEKYTLSK